MVRERTSEYFSRRRARAMEHITGITHLESSESRFKAALVKPAEMRHQWKALDERHSLCPDLGESVGIIRVRLSDSVNHNVPGTIIVWHRVDQPIEFFSHLTLSDNYYAYAAYTAWIAIGCLKIYCCEIQHFLFPVNYLIKMTDSDSLYF